VATVFSTQFLARGGISGVYPGAYIVPAGHVAVVKTFAITIGNNITPGNAYIRHQPSNGVIFSTSVHLTDLPTVDFQTVSQFGTWVLNETESLDLWTTGGWIADFFASGYLLKLP
jgi:hypothetical protein